MSSLVPTVITNKNGIVTTVYRKPADALKTKKLAPVAKSADKGLYDLRKSLDTKLKQLEPDAIDSSWRKREIKAAIEANDLVKLHLMDKYFDAKYDDFHNSVQTVQEAGHDISDSVLFDQVMSFHLSVNMFASPISVAPLVTLFRSGKNSVEEVAHYWNVIAQSEYRSPTLEEVESLLSQASNRTGQLPSFLADSLPVSDTPVQDYRLVNDVMFLQPENYAYHTLDHWDRQSVAYMAGLARKDAKFFGSLYTRFKQLRNNPREATEYAALVDSVSDLFGTRSTGYESHLRGPNAKHIDEVIRLANQYREQSDHPLIESADDLSFYAAQLRFALTIERTKSAFMYGILPMNKAVMQLLREHHSPKEVEVMVNLFNERGIDPELARERLKEQQASAMGSGWL